MLVNTDVVERRLKQIYRVSMVDPLVRADLRLSLDVGLIRSDLDSYNLDRVLCQLAAEE